MVRKWSFAGKIYQLRAQMVCGSASEVSKERLDRRCPNLLRAIVIRRLKRRNRSTDAEAVSGFYTSVAEMQTCC